jgi:hypothetical protein
MIEQARYELLLPGESAQFVIYHFTEPPKKTISRTAAYKPPTYGGLPDITRQYVNRYFTWEMTVRMTGLEVLAWQLLVKKADELALHPTQQFLILKDLYDATSLAVRSDLSSSVVKTLTTLDLPNVTVPDSIGTLIYTAHNVVIESYDISGETHRLDSKASELTIKFVEVL